MIYHSHSLNLSLPRFVDFQFFGRRCAGKKLGKQTFLFQDCIKDNRARIRKFILKKHLKTFDRHRFFQKSQNSGEKPNRSGPLAYRPPTVSDKTGEFRSIVSEFVVTYVEVFKPA